MTSGLRWGVLGTGWIAERQVADLQLDGHVVAAIGSRRAETARAFADRFGVEKAHGSYEELVADPDVDLVYVGTPHTLHAEHALLAIEAVKPVLVEKPFTVNAGEAQRVLDRAEELGVPVLEAMWTRFLPQFVRIRELIADGAIGPVRRVIADNGQVMTTDPAHRINDLSLGGGALLDLGIYPLSLAWMILGAPRSSLSLAKLGPAGADRTVSLLLDYDGGQQAVLTSSADDRGPNRASIIGETGRIDVEPVWYGGRAAFTLVDADGEIRERWNEATPGRGMQYQARELERMVGEGLRESRVLPQAETLAIMRHLDEIRAAIGVCYPADPS